ncbi:VWA domain-containing protein [Paenibacillus cisolokensis]|uniref:VWA domain-containing protein n=1 Tax=Paenibacillus cisolokensis TaxID=1658519 RepID=UPI003D2B4DC4
MNLAALRWEWILTLAVMTASFITILASVIKYRASGFRLLKLIPLGALLIFIVFMAVSDIISVKPQTIREDREIEVYKHAYWLLHDDPGYALARAKQLWQEHPTSDAKLVLAFAYVKSHQAERAHRLLLEVKETGSSLISEEQLKRFIQEMDAGRSLSRVNFANMTADAAGSVSAQGAPASFDARLSDALNPLMEKIVDRLPIGKKHLDALALLDADRMDFIIHALRDSDREQEILDVYEQAMQYLESKDSSKDIDPVFREGMSEAAIFFHDLERAENLLIELIGEYPQDVKAKSLLASLYLDENKEPGEKAGLLPQYHDAAQQTGRYLREQVQVWLDQAAGKGEVDIEQLRDYMGQISQQNRIGSELAYSLLKPFSDENDPDIHYLLSKYYFGKHDLEASSEEIRELSKHPESLESEQQYYVQSLKSLSENPAELTIEQMEKNHELTRDAYLSFKSLNGKRYREEPLSGEELSYSVHLSNELIRLNRSSLHITSVQVDGNRVNVYARSDNMQLDKGGLKLFDNQDAIKTFTFAKLGESKSFKRLIMLVIDRSGSMEGSKIETAKQSAESFIAKLGAHDDVGVIVFSDNNETLVPFTENKADAMEKVSGIQIDGGTNIAPALLAAIDQLEQRIGERVAFILSDGEDDHFSDPAVRQDIIRRARQAGVTIFAIGFDAGYETLRDVAEGTGGRYIGASDLEGLVHSFAEISETLSRSYMLSYKLDSMDPGQHVVKLIQNSVEAAKTYVIGEDGQSVEDEWGDTDSETRIGDDRFYIEQVAPNRIIVSNRGTTTVRVTGNRFDDIFYVKFDGEKIPYKRVDDRTIAVQVNNALPVGVHRITLVSGRQEEASAVISFNQAGPQQMVAFGYATLYGDFLQTKGDAVTLVGNTSIDHFLYDAGGELKMDGDTLSFNGMRVESGGTQMSLLTGEVTMEKDQLGKEMTITPSNAAYTMIDKSSFNRFGLEIQIAPKLTYHPEYAQDEGTLKARAALNGFTKVLALNSPYLEELRNRIKFLPSKSEIELSYHRKGFTAEGTAAADIQVPSLAALSDIELGLKYESEQNRIVFKGEAGGNVDFFGFRLRGIGIGINKMGVEVGLAFPLALNRLGANLEASQGVLLGTTGLQINKVGLMADWSKSREGKIGLGLSTVADRPVQEFIGKINNLPMIGKFIELDENVCVVCLEGEAKVKKFGLPDWSFNGNLTTNLLDFEIAKNSIYFDKNEITFGAKIDLALLTYSTDATILWRDPSFRERTSLKFFGNVDSPGPDGKLTIVMIPGNMDWSFLDLELEVWGKNPHFRIGSDLDVIV